MDIQTQAMKALDVLESSETLHEFDDSVTLRVDRELWEAFLGADNERQRNGHRDDGRGCCADCGAFI